MQANKSQPLSRKPFNMAPLRARIEDTLNKLNDKLRPSKRRISDEGDTVQQSKQPRTLPGQPSNASLAEGYPLFGDFQFPPSATSSQSAQPISFAPKGPASHGLAAKASSSSSSSAGTASYAWDAASRQSRASSRLANKSNSGISSTNPNDLIGNTPPSSPPSRVSPDFAVASPCSSLMAITKPDRPGEGKGIQLLADEKLAKALQDEWDHNAPDVDRPSSCIVTDSGVFGPPKDLDPALSPTAFRDYLARMRCSKCNTAIPLDWEKLVARTKIAVKDHGTLHPFFQCSRCRLWSCAGAGCRVYHKGTPSDLGPSAARRGLKISWCCDGGRQFLVFSLACGTAGPPVSALGLAKLRTRLRRRSETPAATPETEKLTGESSASSKPSGLAAAAKTKALKSRPPKPKSALSKGTGYGGTEYGGMNPLNGLMLPGSPLQSKAKPVSKVEDPELEAYFGALSEILPSYSREGAMGFDYNPQPAIRYMLARSPLLQKASQLLRQTCLEEIDSQANLYTSMLAFLEALTGHADLTQLVYAEMPLYPEDQQLGPSMFPSGAAKLQALGPSQADKTQSLDVLLQQLAEHCVYFEQTASKHLKDFKSSEESHLFGLTRQIIATADAISETRPTPNTPPDAAALEPSGTISTVTTRSRSAKEAKSAENNRINTEMTSFHRENCVDHLPDEKILESFYFADKARVAEKKKPSGGRMKKLVTQILSLRTSLPEGIYVRHGASRLDVMKVLIVGPSGTPYEDGLFEFDLFCSHDYPMQPPEMQFRTTAGGRICFNPNLYNNGKVCLSLLGTWSGQAWEPERSTILQVLVSIQAMIFTSQPWYNEPGREYRLDDNQSKSFNKTIWQYTVRHAMAYWLNERLGQLDKKGKAPARSIPPEAAPPTPVPTVDPKKAMASTASPSAVPSSMPPGPSMPPGLAQLVQSIQFHSTHPPHPVQPAQPAPSGSKLSGLELLNKDLAQWANYYPQQAQDSGMPQEELAAELWVDEMENGSLVGSTEQSAALAEWFASVTGQTRTSPHPIGNTAVDRMDDFVWGAIVRKHFALKGSLIVQNARNSPYKTEPEVQRELVTALEKHNYYR